MFKRLKSAAGRRTRALVGRQAHPVPEPVDDVQLVFDSAFYRETYADIVEAGLEPFNHFRDHGRAEGRQPSALFDPTFYLEQNEDVAAAGIDPLAHFLTSGGAEGRDPIRAGFSSGWYLDRHPDVASAGINPLVHWLTDGVELGYDPCSNFDTSWYLTHNADVAGAGINPLAHYLRHGVGEGRRPNGRGTTLTGSTGNDAEMPTNVSTLLSRRNPDLRVFRTIPGPAVPRINLVTDSIGADSLFGGVATAVIVASAWAEQTGRRLRIVTRHSSPDGAGLDNLFRTIGARPSRQPELAFVPIGPGDYLETGDDDIFLTTSWWTTTSVLRTIPADKVVYILQEDERAFYPTGGDSLAAAAAMNHPGLTVLVNTEGLRQHLMATGIDNLSTTGISFEPSFTPFLRPGRVVGAGGKRNLFFYARPHNPRNLFDVGIAAIDAAIEGGHLPRERWTVHFAGRGVPPIDFCDGSRPVLHDALGWAEYRDLLGRMDLGVSLMASPHPSYPPLDLAASGSVVVTNSWPGKPELIHVSSRLVTAPSTVDGLTEAIAKATVLVESASREPFDPSDAPYFRPWSDNLADVVEHLVRRFGDV